MLPPRAAGRGGSTLPPQGHHLGLVGVPALGAGRLHHVASDLVDAPVKVLQVGQVRRIEILDRLGGHGWQIAQRLKRLTFRLRESGV